MRINKATIFAHEYESRVLFEEFTIENDTNPETGKAGIRCHHWLVAFFLRIFTSIKIKTVNVADGQILYLNKNSYNEWRKRHQLTFPEEIRHDPILPSMKKILANERRMILQNQITNAERSLEALEQQKHQLTEEYMEKIRNYRQMRKEASKNLEILKALTLKKAIKKLINKEEKPIIEILNYDKMITNYDNKIKNIYPQSHARDLNEINQRIEEVRVPLERQKKLLQKTLNEIIPPEIDALNHPEEMFNDIETHTHQNLKRLFETLISKIGIEIVKTWEFSPETGEFTLTLNNKGKLWVPTDDPLAPNGLIFLLGNNQNKIKGFCEKNPCKINFTEGFNGYGKFTALNLAADIEIQSIEYTKNNEIDSITTTSKAKQKSFPWAVQNSKVTEISDKIMHNWGAGKDPGLDHENYNPLSL